MVIFIVKLKISTNFIFRFRLELKVGRKIENMRFFCPGQYNGCLPLFLLTDFPYAKLQITFYTLSFGSHLSLTHLSFSSLLRNVHATIRLILLPWPIGMVLTSATPTFLKAS